MSASCLASVVAEGPRPRSRPLRLFFLGPPGWVESCCPDGPTSAFSARRAAVLEGSDADLAVADARRFAPHVTVVFDPLCLSAAALRGLPGVTLGVLVGGTAEAPKAELSGALGALDRVMSFQPSLSGARIGVTEIWRAVPPPINDALFCGVRPLRGRPEAMTIGRSTEYREYMLMPAKHHHDLLQAIHGVGGDVLVQLLHEYDVGIYVPADSGGGFGAQPGIHLAAGQLLLAHGLRPEHGLERGIDYVSFASPRELVWILDRLARFPEMYQRVRVRGRLKAEGYRASRLFARIAHDLLADVAAFGPGRRSETRGSTRGV